MPETKKGAPKDGAGRKAAGFSEEERAAMRERVKEMRAESRRRARASPEEAEKEVRAKIAAMPAPDRALGMRLHELILAAAPMLVPRLWYGMPAYSKGGEIVCFYQNAGKFKVRYGTLGFSDEAKLDEGRMWPTTFAITGLTPAEEARITELVKRAVG